MNQAFVFLAFGVVVQNAALILQKHTLNHLSLKPWEPGNFLPNFLTLALNHWIILSVIASFISLACWLVALSKLDVSVAYPMVSIGYILSMVAGYYLLGESITPIKLVGVMLIIVGVFCLSRAA